MCRRGVHVLRSSLFFSLNEARNDLCSASYALLFGRKKHSHESIVSVLSNDILRINMLLFLFASDQRLLGSDVCPLFCVSCPELQKSSQKNAWSLNKSCGVCRMFCCGSGNNKICTVCLLLATCFALSLYWSDISGHLTKVSNGVIDGVPFSQQRCLQCFLYHVGYLFKCTLCINMSSSSFFCKRSKRAYKPLLSSSQH